MGILNKYNIYDLVFCLFLIISCCMMINCFYDMCIKDEWDKNIILDENNLILKEFS